MRQNEANADIRRRAAAAGIPLWLLAKTAGIADTTATRWMREELPLMDPRRVRLLVALQQLETEGTGTGQHGKTEKVDGAPV